MFFSLLCECCVSSIHLEVTRNFQLLLKTDSCCECCTLSHAVCKKVNVFLRRLRTILGVKCQMKQSAHIALFLCHWLNSFSQLGWSCYTPQWTHRPRSHVLMFTQADSKRCAGHHQTLVADLADDVSHICSFASWDPSLLDNKGDFNHVCSFLIEQAGDLGCYKCPSCAKPCTCATWHQKHLIKCPQPTGVIMGLNWSYCWQCTWYFCRYHLVNLAEVGP